MLISGNRWNAILHICKHKREGISKSDFKYFQSQTKCNQAYSWVKVYNLYTCGASELVAYKTVVDADGNLPSLDLYQIVSNYNRMVNDIDSIHSDGSDHTKARIISVRIR